MLNETGAFDLIFADAQGGKWEGLDQTISALRPGGLLMVDDMTPTPQWTGEQRTNQDKTRRALLTSPLLISVELDHGSGVILSARHLAETGNLPSVPSQAWLGAAPRG